LITPPPPLTIPPVEGLPPVPAPPVLGAPPVIEPAPPVSVVGVPPAPPAPEHGCVTQALRSVPIGSRPQPPMRRSASTVEPRDKAVKDRRGRSQEEEGAVLLMIPGQGWATARLRNSWGTGAARRRPLLHSRGAQHDEGSQGAHPSPLKFSGIS